jgi:ABC-type nitrate/sulfonate/bicarbonate transport system substrate-binding protein
MKMPILARLVAAGAILAAAAGAAPAQAPKPWKHGIIAPKADAGFLLMAAKRGFAEREGLKLELLEVKDDQIGLKALLAGELDSYEGGAQGGSARRRRQDHGLPLGRRPARHHGQGRH